MPAMAAAGASNGQMAPTGGLPGARGERRISDQRRHSSNRGSARRHPATGNDAVLSIDTTVAHVARVYDYWLGGKDNFAADRLAGEQAIQAYPDIVYSVRANRAFLARTVRYLAREAGIRQFLDIGTGIPTANNTHEVAQSAVPGCRVVYVDNDPWC